MSKSEIKRSLADEYAGTLEACLSPGAREVLHLARVRVVSRRLWGREEARLRALVEMLRKQKEA